MLDYLKKNGIWLFGLVFFGITSIYSLVIYDLPYLAFSLVALGFFLNNLMFKQLQAVEAVIEGVMMVLVAVLRLVRINNDFLWGIICVAIVVSNGYIWYRRRLTPKNNQVQKNDIEPK